MSTKTSERHWQSAYASKQADCHSWYQAAPEQSLGWIAKTDVAKTDPIIDVGAGASCLVDSLLGNGFTDLTALDLSERALSVSKARLGAASEGIEWICDDVRHFEPARRYRLWHDRACLHFMREETDRSAYIETLLKALEPGGHLIIAAFSKNGPKRCSGLDIIQYDDEAIQLLFGEHFQLMDQALETHHTPTGGEQSFAWFWLTRVKLAVLF